MVGRSKTIGIIGGGLAGGWVAYHGLQKGLDVTIFDKNNLASGASGNELGLLNPKFYTMSSPAVVFYQKAFHYAIDILSLIQKRQDIGFQKCGSFHAFTEEKKQKKLEKFIKVSDWNNHFYQLMNNKEAEKNLGFGITYDGLFLSHGSKVSPSLLVKVLCKDAKIKEQSSVVSIQKDKKEDLWRVLTADEQQYEFDYIVIACGLGAEELNWSGKEAEKVKEKIRFLLLFPIRGQITKLYAPELTENFKSNFCFGGYLSVLNNDHLIVGATYDRGDKNDQHKKEDDQRNVDYLLRYLPSLKTDIKIIDGRASQRVSTPQAFPVFGEVDQTKAYLSLAHRSHGLVSTPLIGKEIVDSILAVA